LTKDNYMPRTKVGNEKKNLNRLAGEFFVGVQLGATRVHGGAPVGEYHQLGITNILNYH